MIGGIKGFQSMLSLFKSHINHVTSLLGAGERWMKSLIPEYDEEYCSSNEQTRRILTSVPEADMQQQSTSKLQLLLQPLS